MVLDYQELQLSTPSTLFEKDGKPWEHVHGVYIPRRLCFIDFESIEGKELCAYFDEQPPNHSTRAIKSALAWHTPTGKNYYRFGIRAEPYPSLLIIARRCIAQARVGSIQSIDLIRDWSPPPPSPARLIPNPKRLHQYYGGNPITIWLNERIHKRQLFIGGIDIQGDRRPNVDCVLNVGEDASRWTTTTPLFPDDRWDNKGEGSKGMDVNEIADEARWVIERLQVGQRVLVHCTGGMNRSATICCAVLILLEGLSAETALERVREYHPWARPDPYHWLALRWLAHSANTFMSEKVG